ncbi:1660_t:CDS:2, partial [Entrophospora sp. SA101]
MYRIFGIDGIIFKNNDQNKRKHLDPKIGLDYNLNSAVDELEKRFKQGVYNKQTKVLRFGRNESFERSADSELRSRLKKLENEIFQTEQKINEPINDAWQFSTLQAKSNRLKAEKKFIIDELTKLTTTNS